MPEALTYPQFRNYWAGLLVAVTGYQMLVLFSLGWLITQELSGDTRSLGYMSTAVAGPAILLTLFGGVFADKLNPKHLLFATQSSTGMVVLAVGLLVALDKIHQWHVLVAAFIIGSVQAFDNPTRQSIFPRLVSRDALYNAVALNSSVWTGTRIFGPLAAGIIIGRTDTYVAIFVTAAGFFTMALVARSLRLSTVRRAHGGVLREMAAGFGFLRRHSLFLTLIGMAFFNGMFGMSYIFLMPVFADDVLDVGPEKLGLLMGAAGTGALLGIVLAANARRFPHKGWLLLGGAAAHGACLVLFALVSDAGHYRLSMVTLFAADLFVSVHLMMVMTTLQTLVPDDFRGRVMGFYTITWSMIPLGGLQASQIAHHISPPIAVAIGGLAVAALAMLVGVTNRRVRDIGLHTGTTDRAPTRP
ncbi:MAG: MFS transporter [Dehalococcoidia bacterium]|nr:MFS transporter [Dehalococcoidia bacterium]